MTEPLAHGYSSKSTLRELSNEYQHDSVKMVFKNLCIHVLWRKVASALEGLNTCSLLPFINEPSNLLHGKNSHILSLVLFLRDEIHSLLQQCIPHLIDTSPNDRAFFTYVHTAIVFFEFVNCNYSYYILVVFLEFLNSSHFLLIEL